MKLTIIKSVIILINLVVYLYGLVVIFFFLGSGWNFIFVPDDCWPVRSAACSLILRLILWGGAFVEAAALASALFLLGRAVLRSFLASHRMLLILFWIEMVVALLLFASIAITVN